MKKKHIQVIDEKIIGFAVAMFVLSQISERVTNFFKLHFLKKDDQVQLANSPVKGAMYERRVFYLSLLGGVITTALFVLTFFVGGKEDPENALNWLGKYFDSTNLGRSISAFISISIFLSFGSKFWHDILDIIFFYKNMRRKLSDPLLYQQESTQQIELFLEGTTQELAEAALEDQFPELRKLEGFVGISTAYSESKGEHILRVRFEEASNFSGLKQMVYYRDQAGMKRRIGAEYLAAGKVMAHSKVDYGLEVGAENYLANGRCCYFFKSTENGNNQIYGLTCAHVFGYGGRGTVTGPFSVTLKQNVNSFLPWDTQIKYVDGYDAAVFPIPELQNIDLERISGIVGTSKVGRFEDDSIVFISSNKGTIRARIENEDVYRLTIHYSDKESRTFTGLIAIKNECSDVNSVNNGPAPTVPGDSGGLVYLYDKRAIGMIVAGDNIYSYAIKLTEIEERMKIRLCPISELRELQNALNT